ncbi:CatB-related O-acetyltransferase [Kordiimonas marina]|uniref:CatB-related O-acetyltransferase n=1 Tax=Kordiimonas marina TaxID=2872312 RepID=UPI001FF55E37|nr:CatB-related O-acetyltransferase [Kordiimonas marina]MCJ9430607.1 CatB-related O-acetyltransferase [Kordiimonas marina]
MPPDWRPKDKARSWTVGDSPVSVGRFTYAARPPVIKEWGEGAALEVGAFCSIAEDVVFCLGGNHRTDWIATFPFSHLKMPGQTDTPILGHPATRGDIKIGNDVWIGFGATIMSGVTVGDGAVIGANAMVLRDVAPYTVVGGNPARAVRRRFDDDMITLLTQLRWWDLETEEIGAIAQDLTTAPTLPLLKDLLKRFRPSI